jgi:UDP-glucuronate 4-epimerase
MRIIITGVSGFIGFHFAKFLLLKRDNQVFGVDELNTYYDVNLKKERLKILKLKKNFQFKKLDISKKDTLEKIFKTFKPDVVYHFAAQAGVRYSLQNPKKYFDSNCLGFFNLFEIIRKYKTKKVYYASSSSVYGDTKIFPTSENANRNPKNFYAVTKCFNEELAEIYSKMYNINNVVCLRFFTVFGEWGRPDMFIYKLLEAKKNKKIFKIYNYGNYLRDFTYIEDAIKQVMSIKTKKRHEIYNICSSRPVSLKKVISIIKKNTLLPKINYTKKNNLDVFKTYGSNRKVFINKNFVYTPINVSISKTVKWYLKFYKIK